MPAADCENRIRHRPSREESPSAARPWHALPILGVLISLAAISSFGEDLSGSSGTASSSDGNSDSAVAIGPIAADTTTAANTTTETNPAGQVPDEVQRLLTRLESARAFLRETDGYTALFTQQVRKEGRLFDPERIQLKVRHKPFSVFMQWEEDGQQLLYVDGQQDNKLLVHATRGLGRVRRFWILEPTSGLVMATARRPVTEIGLLNLVDLLLGFHREHVLASHCVSEPSGQADQSLTRFVLTFDHPGQNPYFARTDLWLCDERHLPVRIDNYGWTQDNALGPLLERYDYNDLCLGGCVTDTDFDRDNEAYSF